MFHKKAINKKIHGPFNNKQICWQNAQNGNTASDDNFDWKQYLWLSTQIKVKTYNILNHYFSGFCTLKMHTWY